MMWLLHWILYLLFLGIGFKMGRLYQDFRDLMLARRVSQLSKQAEKLEQMRRNWEHTAVTSHDD